VSDWSRRVKLAIEEYDRSRAPEEAPLSIAVAEIVAGVTLLLITAAVAAHLICWGTR
jgi:hypothetical protein